MPFNTIKKKISRRKQLNRIYDKEVFKARKAEEIRVAREKAKIEADARLRKAKQRANQPGFFERLSNSGQTTVRRTAVRRTAVRRTPVKRRRRTVSRAVRRRPVKRRRSSQPRNDFFDLSLDNSL